jgi:hypothetical protein
VKRWLLVLPLLLGMIYRADAGQIAGTVALDAMAQLATGASPLARLAIPIQPEITGEVHRLDVLRKHPISKFKSAYEMRCLPAGSCAFPFIVIVEKPDVEEAPLEYVLQKGDVVVLRLFRKGYSAQLFGVCMEKGGINDLIKVTSVDGQQWFKAKVIDRNFVISEKSEL